MRAVSLENHNFLKSEVDFYCINCDFLTAKEKKEALFDFFFVSFPSCYLAKEPKNNVKLEIRLFIMKLH
jgi:hypothetical protein